MADREEGLVVGEGIDVGMGVDIGDVRQVVTLRLSPTDVRILVTEIMASAIAIVRVEGTVKRYLRRVRILINAFVCGVIVHTHPTPFIVGLIGGHTGL